MILECVPNFSEGRDPLVVSAIARAVSNVTGVTLLDSAMDADHNRSVLTFAGTPQGVAEAAFEAARVAVHAIDLTHHVGVHPRLGAIDVLPFVPVDEMNLAQCATIAKHVGFRIWNELKLPVHLYEAAAKGRKLEYIRKHATELPPDYGEGRHPTAGVCVVGARKFLIAWNINLRSTNLAAARTIAREIRESSGGLPAVKALGFPLESKSQVQVSINLTDFEATSLHAVFDAVKQRCTERGIEIEGSELIGMIPSAALRRSEGHDLRWLNLSPELVLENRLR